MQNFHSHVALYQTCDFHCILCINTLSLEYVVPIGMTYLKKGGAPSSISLATDGVPPWKEIPLHAIHYMCISISILFCGHSIICSNVVL